MASSSSNNGAGANSGRSGFSMRGNGLHGNRKNSNNNQGGGPHGRHNPPATTGLQAGASSQQPLVSGSSSGGSSGGSMAASGSATGSNAINSNRMYNEGNYLADQQSTAGALGQTPLYANSKSSYNSTNRGSNQAGGSHSLGGNGSNNLPAGGLAGGSASSQQASLSGSRTSSYPPSSYRNSYVNAGDYGPPYPKKKSPNELATNSSSNPSASGRGGPTDHSHYSSSSSSSKNANLTNPASSGLLSSFNQKSNSRDLDQKSVSSSSSLKGRNNNSRGKKSPRDEQAGQALLPSTHAYAEHHAGGYHNQNVYNTGYREGSRGGHEGGRREPRSKNRTETAGYVNSSSSTAAKDDHHKQQFDLQATAFPPLPGANKPGDSANSTANQTAGATPATSSTAKPTALKGVDGSHADGTSGCLADVVKGVKVQREPAGAAGSKSTGGEEADSQSSSNSKKGQKSPAPANHSLNSSSPSAGRPASFDEATTGKPTKSCSTTASSSCPPAASASSSGNHPNASQVDSYANLTSNNNSQVPAKSNNNKSASSGSSLPAGKCGQSKGDQLCSPDEPLNESRAADSSSVSSRSACSYSSTADSQRSGELPASRSKLSIDSNASSTSSQQTDRLAQATAECTLNGHLEEKCSGNSKKLMSYSDVAKLLKNNGGNGDNGNDNGVSLNDCSQNSSASSSNSNSLNTPLNSKSSAIDPNAFRSVCPN